MAAVIEDPDAIKHVNPHNNNYNRIAMTAVMQDANAIKHVNMSAIKNVYREIALAAVMQNANAIQYVDSRDNKDYKEIALVAVMQNPHAIAYVNYSHKHYEDIALAAVMQHPTAILSVKGPDTKASVELKRSTSVVINGVVVSTDPNNWTPMTNRIMMRLWMQAEDEYELRQKSIGQDVAQKYVGTLHRSLYSDRKFWLVYIPRHHRPDKWKDTDYLVLSTDPDDPQTYTYENTTI